MFTLRKGIATFVVMALAAAMLPGAVFAAPVGPAAVELRPDAYEPLDDDPTTAPMLSETSKHTFSSDTDQDWSIISADTTGQPFVLETVPVAPGYQIDAEMYVYAMDENGEPDGAYLEYSDDGTWTTYGSTIYFEAPAPGDYLVLAEPLTDGEIGSYMMYQAYGIARRISGGNRFATSAAVSKTMMPMTDLYYSYSVTPPSAIVIANGLNWADALVGSDLALALDGQLLLVTPDSIPAETDAEIRRLLTAAGTAATEVPCYVLGGTGAVSANVEALLKEYDGLASVDRLSGSSRYATAAAISQEIVGLSVTGTAWIVSGESPWDALGVGAVAGYNGDSMLMSQKSKVPSETIDFITDNGITNVVVAGGPSVIDATAYAQLTALPGVTVERVFGSNRYETAREIAQYGVDTYSMIPGSVVLVSGEGWADGLSAAMLTDYTYGPMLLTQKSMLSESVYEFFEENGMPTEASYLVGGEAAVSDDAYFEFQFGVWDYLMSLPI